MSSMASSTGVSSGDRDAIELLRRLVSIPSLSGDEAKASEFLAAWMAERGFEAGVDPSGSAVGVIGGVATREGRNARGTRDIVLLGHIDTVPGEIPVRIEHGELWGRGAVDAKGSLATFAAAAAGMTLPPGVRVIVIGATEEEAATSRGARHAARAYDPVACVIGEPSGSDAVTIGYKGRLVVDAEIRTPASHSAGPEPSAAELGVQLWNDLRDVASRRSAESERLFDRTQVKLRSFVTRSDGLHDVATMQVGFRLPPGISPQHVEQQCRTVSLRADFEFSGHEYAYAGDGRSWLARALTGGIRERGRRPRLLLKTGTSDMNVVGRVWKCPVVAYGPGDSAMDHTPHERLPIDEYLGAIATLRAGLERIVEHVASGDGAPIAAS